MSEETSKKGREKRLEYCHKWHQKLDQAYSNLKTQREKAMKYADADPSIVKVIEGRSKITTTDMQDAIDMAKPDILETIAGIDEPLKLDPDHARFTEGVKKLEVLGNVMLKRKNEWFSIANDFLDDSMKLKFGAIKYRWVTETKDTEKTYEGLNDIELQSLLQKEGAVLVSDSSEEDGEGTKRTTIINYRLSDEFVKLNAVPSERIKFPLDSKSFSTTPIVIEEVCEYEHEFVRMYGKDFFEKVKEASEELSKQQVDSEFEKRFKHLGGVDHLYDKKNDKYKAYEAYFYWDGKPWTMTYSGDIVHEKLDVENKYGKPPYEGGSPFLVAHSLIGKGYLDLLKNIQEERTYLKRQIHDIISQNNFRRYFVNVAGCGMNIKDYENASAMNALVRCDGPVNSDYIAPEVKIPLGEDVLAFWEMLKSEKDAHIPTPRAFEGLEAGKDERTYRGKQLKVNQASKKLLMMTRGYMEKVFKLLFQDILDCIAKFMKKSTVVRYLNEDYEISPEDVICKYALVVNVGLGAHDKQDLVVKLQQLIGLANQEIASGIITSQNLYYMFSELIKAMGFLNVNDFVTDPKIKEVVLQFVQLASQILEGFSQIHEGDPETAMLAQQFMEMAQVVMAALGIKQPDNSGGENAKGTMRGEKPAAIQTQPNNEFNPQLQISGGGYFA